MTRWLPLAALACALAPSGPARAQHAGDMLIGSTASGSGALGLAFDFDARVRVFESASGGGNVLYSSTDPGWDLLASPASGLVPLAANTTVSVQITAIEPGVSLKIGATTLSAAGQTRLLGTAPSIHVHPTWQLVLPQGVQGERRVSFTMTSGTPGYAASPAYTAILSNTTSTTTTTSATVPGATTTTSSTRPSVPTTSTTVAGATSTTSSTTAVTAPLASTTSTTRPGDATLPPPGDRLQGASLVLRARRRATTLSVASRDPAVGPGGERGGSADPTVHGATLQLTAGPGTSAEHGLPARNWRALLKRGVLVGWRYTDPRRTAGPVSRIVLRRGRQLVIAAAGPALGVGLGVDPQVLGVVLAAGNHRWCLAFGGSTVWKPDVSFIARHAAPPAACSP